MVPLEGRRGKGSERSAKYDDQLVEGRCQPLGTIRTLSVSDLPAFFAWRGGDDYKDQLLASHFEQHQARERTIFVAVDGDRLTGTVQFVARHSDPDLGDGTRTGYLEALEVMPESRRAGLGARLSAAVEAEAGRRGCARLTLMVEPENLPAVQLYLKLGYTVFKESTWEWRGQPRRALCMSKPVRGEVERCVW